MMHQVPPNIPSLPIPSTTPKRIDKNLQKVIVPKLGKVVRAKDEAQKEHDDSTEVSEKKRPS